MFNRKLYHDAVGELHASPDKIQEVIDMIENNTAKKHRHPIRIVAVAAAAVAMLTFCVSAAASEELQEFILTIVDRVQVDSFRDELIMDDGTQITAFRFPEAAVENRDGRAILVLDGEDAADITDALAEQGSYTYQIVDGDTQLIIEAEGTADDWTLRVSVAPVGEEPEVYINFSSEDTPWMPSDLSELEDGDLTMEFGYSVITMEGEEDGGEVQEGTYDITGENGSVQVQIHNN